MKSFIGNSIIFFVLGVVATVGVFYMVNKSTITPSDIPGFSSSQSVQDVVEETKQIQETLSKVPEQGIPLSTLKLNDTQESTLKKVGIDTESFVITKEMVGCSAEKLGAARTQELIEGASPSLIEITTLTPCLKNNQ